MENDLWVCVREGNGKSVHRKRVEARRIVIAVLQSNPTPFELPDFMFNSMK